ncbi:MAG: Spy/CpxP family protein refolding chaperone [Candidatus Obscuribacterales bacterium]|nr:Spy/CpxP family protein refolding chaperone [Candidatus Obscuribacterales bacterium]
MKLIRQLVIASALLSALPAYAQSTTITAELPKDGAKASCAGKGCFDSKLKPTDEQRQKLGDLRNQFTLSTASKKAELEVAQRQLRDLLGKATIDKQAALDLQGKINGLRADLSNARLSMMLSASDVFTPEQRAEFSKMHHMGGFRHGGAHGGFHGEGQRKAPKVS